MFRHTAQHLDAVSDSGYCRDVQKSALFGSSMALLKTLKSALFRHLEMSGDDWKHCGSLIYLLSIEDPMNRRPSKKSYLNGFFFGIRLQAVCYNAASDCVLLFLHERPWI